MDSSLTQAGDGDGHAQLHVARAASRAGRFNRARRHLAALGLVLYEVLGYRQAFSGETPRRSGAESPTSSPRRSWTSIRRSTRRSPASSTAPSPSASTIATRTSTASAPTCCASSTACSPCSPGTRWWTSSQSPSSRPQCGVPRSRALAERRATQIAAHIRRAEEAFAAGSLEDAQEAAEEAALLDTGDPRVVVLIERIRHALDVREVAGLVAEADAALRAGSLTAASGLVAQALEVDPTHAQALALRAALQQANEEREQSRERAGPSRGRSSRPRPMAGRPRRRHCARTSEALCHDPSHPEALALKARVGDLVRRRLDEVLAAARADVAAQRYTAALRRLDAVRPRDERVEALEAEVRRAWTAARDDTIDVAPPVRPQTPARPLTPGPPADPGAARHARPCAAGGRDTSRTAPADRHRGAARRRAQHAGGGGARRPATSSTGRGPSSRRASSPARSASWTPRSRSTRPGRSRTSCAATSTRRGPRASSPAPHPRAGEATATVP